jgi:hypothetical protein
MVSVMIRVARTWPVRRRAALAVVAALSLSGLIGVAHPAAASSTTPTLLWGVSGANSKTEIQTIEGKVGRQLGAVRVFLNWDTPFPDADTNWIVQSSRVPVISVRAQRVDKSVVLWRDIADAAPGSALYAQTVGWADKIKALGVPVYFAFNHEPEATASDAMGTSTDFIAAYNKVSTVFRAQGVTNAKMMWIMTANAYFVGTNDDRYYQHWFPGDAAIDAMGIDAYNNFTCTGVTNSPWKSLQQKIEPFRQFGALHSGKELWLPEWATTEDPNSPNRKSQWIDDARALFKQPGYGQFVGIMYFNLFRRGTPCEWFVDSDPASLASFTAMGADPFYGRFVSGGQPPPPTETLLSRGKSAGASSVVSTTFSAPKAVDSDVTTTRWASAAGKDPQWIRVNLGASHTITRVKLTWASEYADGYQIQLSPDGSAWSTVFTATAGTSTAGDGGVDDMPVTGSATWVRVLGNHRATSGGYSLYDFAVYGI